MESAGLREGGEGLAVRRGSGCVVLGRLSHICSVLRYGVPSFMLGLEASCISSSA